MGGFGSGRSSGFGGRRVADGCRSLDINRLNRDGCLNNGFDGVLSWTREGESLASIRVKAEEGRLVVSYRVRVSEGDWEDVREMVRIVRVPCRFGGTRPYFYCPGVNSGVACERRVAKLFGAGRYFLCRHCYGLSYASQGEGQLDRARRRALKINRRLGTDGASGSSILARPKGMWTQTYERLREKSLEAEMEADELFSIEAMKLIGRFDSRAQTRRFW